MDGRRQNGEVLKKTCHVGVILPSPIIVLRLNKVNELSLKLKLIEKYNILSF
jgi:hypothetical protein